MTVYNRFLFSRRLLFWLALLVSLGFGVSSWSGYQASRSSIRNSIVETELPLTADNIYSEIRKDLVPPVLVSSTMAQDTYVRDWVIDGECDARRMTRYLREIKERYGAFTAFFVSERTRTYYHVNGPLRQVDLNAPQDSWYARVRAMSDDYEINVDRDSATPDQLTIFINYRMLDFQGRYLGAIGVGLTVDSVMRLIDQYQERFHRKVYFVSPHDGRIVMSGTGELGRHIGDIPGLGAVGAEALARPSGVYSYQGADGERLLHVRAIPELKWHLFVERSADEAYAAIRRALYVNALICVLVTGLVVAVIKVMLDRHHSGLQTLATTDALTGLANRHGFKLLLTQAMRRAERSHLPLNAILFDLDHFKHINDTHGHQAGDLALQAVAQVLRQHLRQSDAVARWGGEEFLVLLENTDADQAAKVADTLRQALTQHSLQHDGQAVVLSASFGVAQWHEAENSDDWLNRVDRAMYAAKNAGRDCVRQG